MHLHTEVHIGPAHYRTNLFPPPLQHIPFCRGDASIGFDPIEVITVWNSMDHVPRGEDCVRPHG